jgi:hypothetical protein
MMRAEQATELRELQHPFGLAFGNRALSDSCVYSVGSDASSSGYMQWIPTDTRGRNWGGCHAPSLAWAVVEAYQSPENVTTALGVASTVIGKYRDMLRDMWNMPDISTSFHDEEKDVWIGWSACNSHYMRNLIAWGLPLALNRQQFHGGTGMVAGSATLSFEPWSHGMARLPFFTPLADGIVTRLPADGGYRVKVVAGTLALTALKVATVGSIGPLVLRAGETAIVRQAAG